MEAGLSEVVRLLDRAVTLRGQVETDLAAMDAEILSLEQEDLVLEMVGSCIRSMIDTEISDAVTTVAELQTEALQAVFPDQDNMVRPEVEIKRGKVSVNFLTQRTFSDGTVVEGDPVSSFGGAIATMQSVLFRITIMMRRGLRPFLILDETLPAISSTYLQKAVQFLSVLCDRIGMDVLIVSHDPLLTDCANRAYRIQNVNGEAILKEIR